LAFAHGLARVSGSSTREVYCPMSDPFRQLARFLVRAEATSRSSRALAAARGHRFPTGLRPALSAGAPPRRWLSAADREVAGHPPHRPAGHRRPEGADRQPTRATSSPASRPTTSCSPAPAGSGKSSLIKALLNEYAANGLRVIEVEKGDLTDLPDIVELIEGRPERFIIFCDDLSFDAGDARYKALKVVLDGSLAAPPDNVLIYATSNRRHLMPEFSPRTSRASASVRKSTPARRSRRRSRCRSASACGFPSIPSTRTLISTSLRTGCKPSAAATTTIAAAERDALNWALERGSRSGRVAWQFARDWAGRTAACRIDVRDASAPAMPYRQRRSLRASARGECAVIHSPCATQEP
jgi:hypothetical protein